MKKINSILFAAVLALSSCYVQAANIESCDYPQHFKIVGGKITAIEAIQSPTSELNIVLKSENSFDVYDNAHCQNERPRMIKLNVELDSIHKNEMVFADSPNGKITRIRNNSLNDYDLDAINRLSTTDYELVYKVKKLGQASFAISTPPSTCPAIDAIKKVGFTSIHQTYSDAWQATTNNHFGTNDEWTLSTGIIRFFENGNDALVKANALIPTLTLSSGPDKMMGNTWACWYKTQQPADPIVFALTPSETAPESNEIKQ